MVIKGTLTPQIYYEPESGRFGLQIVDGPRKFLLVLDVLQVVRVDQDFAGDLDAAAESMRLDFTP